MWLVHKVKEWISCIGGSSVSERYLSGLQEISIIHCTNMNSNLKLSTDYVNIKLMPPVIYDLHKYVGPII